MHPERPEALGMRPLRRRRGTKPEKAREVGSPPSVTGLTIEPIGASAPGYWLHIAAPEKTGESVREREQRALRRALAQINAFTAEDERKLVAKQKGRCAICGRRLGKKYHLDHVVPITSGGSLAKSNLQIAHPACNHRKHANDPFVFLK